ncbi:MAG: DUF1559 domain-containing protein [Planctomycetes bacterium]|nr:DUF1559 domain-containing protein [Planctomycetota bacterium]
MILVLLILAIPTIFFMYRRAQRGACQENLRQISSAILDYHTNHAELLPCGARYEGGSDTPFGTSWWVEILPHLGLGEEGNVRWQRTASSGKFDLRTSNQNVKFVDGLQPPMMQCPASYLPPLNDPLKHLSVETRGELKDHRAIGLAVPTYVAIAGSAPDMLGLKPNQPVSGPHGRNTRDGKYGILSGSGVFPPNQPIRLALVRDGQAHVIMIGEQSGQTFDEAFTEPVEFDLRSAWPDGAYTGSGGKYVLLRPDAEGVSGSGDEPCYNITTIRYGVNSQAAFDVTKPARGISVRHDGPYPPPPKDTPPRVPAKFPPGPGHNHGLFSAHSGGAYVLYVDGHTDFLSDEVEPYVLQMLATRDDGNITKLDH